MEVTTSNGLTMLVETHEYNFGQVGPKDVINYDFKFLGLPSQIEYIEKTCGCTSAFLEGGYFKGEIDMAAAGDYKPGENTVTKWVYVWLNDGYPRFIANERKEKQLNQLKSYFKLKIYGQVIVD